MRCLTFAAWGEYPLFANCQTYAHTELAPENACPPRVSSYSIAVSHIAFLQLGRNPNTILLFGNDFVGVQSWIYSV